MQTRSICWSSVIILAVTGSSWAQLPTGPSGSAFAPVDPVEMTIVPDEVEIRSGPTMTHYATSKLRRGERVFIRPDWKGQPGWLAINPPPGSFSWIRANCVTPVNSQIGAVDKETRIMPASSLVRQKLNVETITVKPGTQVVILDKAYLMEGESWLPIVPPVTDVRYIHASDVQAPAPPQDVSPSGFPTQVGSTDKLAQAEQANSVGDVERAKQLYHQVYDKTVDPQQKAVALNRLTSMPASANSAPGNNSNWQPNAPGQQNLVKPAGQTTTTYSTPASTMTNIQPPQWSTWGYLRRASFDKDGQPVYVLENRKKEPLLYAVTEPGHSQTLTNLAGRFVCLYGPISYRSDDYPRVQFMVVSHFAVP